MDAQNFNFALNFLKIKVLKFYILHCPTKNLPLGPKLSRWLYLTLIIIFAIITIRLFTAVLILYDVQRLQTFPAIFTSCCFFLLFFGESFLRRSADHEPEL